MSKENTADERAAPVLQDSAPASYGNFVEASAVKTAFLQHVKDTNEPETFPGLCHTKPEDEKPRFVLIVDEFDIDPAKRPDGEFIRCAACATKKKFRRGSLAWYPEEGVLRVVGNECGNERRVEAREDYRRRNTLEILSSYLHENLPKVHEYIRAAHDMRDAAKHAQELSLALRTQAPSFGQTLLRAVKGDGRLKVYESELREDGHGRLMTLAQPAGLDFLRSKFQPLRLVDEAITRLNQADHGSPSRARRWLAPRLENLDELTAAYSNLTHGLRKLEEARTLIKEVGAFLNSRNLNDIDTWARTHRNGLRAQWGVAFSHFVGPALRGKEAGRVTLYPKWSLLGLPRPAM